MKALLTVLVFAAVAVALSSLVLAVTAPHVATVTYTRHDGSTWIDSGTIVEDHQFASEFKGYSYRFVVFTDHVNEYHLGEGNVDIVWR